MSLIRSITGPSRLRTLQVTALAMPTLAHRSPPKTAAAPALLNLHVQLRAATRQLALLGLAALS